MDETSQKIGVWLKNVRQYRGVTLPQLAYLTGLSHAQLSRIETGSSAVTLFTLVRIFHAFSYTFTAIYDDLGLGRLIPPVWKDGKVAADIDKYPALTIADIENFVALHEKKPAFSSQLLLHLVDIKPVDAFYKRSDSISCDQTLIELFHRYVNWDYDEYPPVTLNNYRQIYLSGGCMMLKDLGGYIKECRLVQGLSLRQLAKDTNISHPGLIKFEQGVSNRVKLVDLIELDRALSLDGELLAVAWRVAELYTGVQSIKSGLQRGSEPPTAWTDEQMRWIERLLLVSRLYQHYLPEHREWLDVFRKQVLH
jgi:transcriptional regulator with XRE-family HTH domain